MKQFYAKVVPKIRRGRFGKYGKEARILLRQDNQMAMIAVYHALEPYRKNIAAGFDKLFFQDKILSNLKGNSGEWPKPLKWWSEALFEALESNDYPWFAADKEKFRKFRSYFFDCRCC